MVALLCIETYIDHYESNKQVQTYLQQPSSLNTAHSCAIQMWTSQSGDADYQICGHIWTSFHFVAVVFT